MSKANCKKCKWSNADSTRCFKLFELRGLDRDKIRPVDVIRCTNYESE